MLSRLAVQLALSLAIPPGVRVADGNVRDERARWVDMLAHLQSNCYMYRYTK